MLLWRQFQHWVCRSLSALHIWPLQSPFIFAELLHLSQVAWRLWVNSLFQVHPQILNWIEIWLGHSRTLALFLSHSLGLGFTLEVIVLLENKSSPKSQVSCRLRQVFLQFFCIHLTLTSLPGIPMLPPPGFTVRIVFLWWCTVFNLRQTWHLLWLPKSSIEVSLDHKTLFQMASQSTTCLLENCRPDLIWQQWLSLCCSAIKLWRVNWATVLHAHSLQSQSQKLVTASLVS